MRSGAARLGVAGESGPGTGAAATRSGPWGGGGTWVRPHLWGVALTDGIQGPIRQGSKSGRTMRRRGLMNLKQVHGTLDIPFSQE